MRTKNEIIKDMRHAAGSRIKLAIQAGVSENTAQGWEKSATVPTGRPLARLVRAQPDLGQELLDALAVDEAISDLYDGEPDAGDDQPPAPGAPRTPGRKQR